MKMIQFALCLFCFFSCNSEKVETNPNPIQDIKALNYLALGDSYTIGESVGEKERFPFQLFNNKNLTEHKKGEYKIIAKTGWTTRNLLDAMEKDDLKPGEYNFITLLIGVNNQYQGKPFSQYETELEELIDRSINLLEGKAQNLILISIPDYSVTPFAASGNTTKIAEEIKKYNDFKENLAKSKGAQYVYITDLTQNAKNDPSLLADDKLHPSGKSYGEWTERVVPLLNEIIGKL